MVFELLCVMVGIDEKLFIECDSCYVIDFVIKWMLGWKWCGWCKFDGGLVFNCDLLEGIDEVICGCDVEFFWVKGYVGYFLNEVVDECVNVVVKVY